MTNDNEDKVVNTSDNPDAKLRIDILESGSLRVTCKNCGESMFALAIALGGDIKERERFSAQHVTGQCVDGQADAQ